MSTLTIPINGQHVEVEFAFWKGYPSTFDEPGCPDECEVHKVWYPVDSENQVNILPVMHEEDIEAIYNYIYDYKEEP